MSERRLLLASGVYIDLSEYLLKSEAETLYAPLDAILNKQDKLISGTNIKTINNENILGSGNITISLTESDIATMGFTKNTGTYSKPSGGIPKSDLASAVQTSLGKADTALQSYTEQYKGTVTGVKINGSTKSPSSGTVDIGSVATTVKIDNVSKSPSSGTIDLGYINKRYSGITSSSVTLTPNIYYRNTSTSLSSFSFTLGSVSNSNIINEYFIEFTTSSSGTTVSLPSGIKWMNGVTPTFEASTTYQISIVNNLGTWVKFK